MAASAARPPMHRPALLALALVALLAAPLGAGRYVVEGRSPWEAGYSFNPQFYCVVVYDEPGSQACSVRGKVTGVDIVRVRMAGPGTVHVSVVDMSGPLGLPEQRAIVDCTSSCVVPIPYGPHSDTDWLMRVDTATTGRGAIQVSLETRASLTPDRDL